MTEEELANSPIIRMAGSDGGTYETTADRASEMAYAAQAEGVALKPFVKTKDAEGNVHEISPFDGAALKEAQDRGDERHFEGNAEEDYFSAEALKAGAARFAIGLVYPWDWLRGIGTAGLTVARGLVKGTVGTAVSALHGGARLGENAFNLITGDDGHELSDKIGKVKEGFNNVVDAATPDLFELTGEYDGVEGAKKATGAARSVAEMVANVKGMGALSKGLKALGATQRAAHGGVGIMFGLGKYGDVATDPNGPGGWRQEAAALAAGTADAVIFGLWNPFKIGEKARAALKPFAEATRREVTKRVALKLAQAFNSGASMATVEAAKQGAEQVAGAGTDSEWGERTLAESAKEIGTQFLIGSAFVGLEVLEENAGRIGYNRARKAQGINGEMKVAMSYQVERNRKDICPKYHKQAVYAYNRFVRQGGRAESFKEGLSASPDVRRVNEDGSVVFDDGSVWRADPRMEGGATITVSDGTILSESGELLGYRARQEAGAEARPHENGATRGEQGESRAEAQDRREEASGDAGHSEEKAAPRAENALTLLQQMDEGALPVVDLAVGDIEGRAPTENGNEIAEYDAAKATPIVVLEDLEGNYLAMTGGKRLMMAGASGAETIKAVVVRESDGWTADMADGLNATENLRGGNATMKNVVAAVDTIGAEKVAEIAGWHQANGSREMASKIRRGLAIAQKSGAELRAALEAGSVSEEFAYNAAQTLSMERIGEGWQEAQRAIAELAGRVGPEELDAVLWGLKKRITPDGQEIDWDAAIAEERAKYNTKKGGTEGQLDSDQVLIETEDGELKTLGEVEAENGSASAKGSGATSGEDGLTQRRGEAESAENSKVPRAVEEIDRTDGTDLKGVSDLVEDIQQHGKPTHRGQKHFKLAKTSDVLKNVGLTGDYFTIKSGVIFKHYGKDADHMLTAADWANISESLSDPLVVAQYSWKDANGIIHRPKNSYSIWTEAVINGKFAMVGVEVKSPGKEITVNSITTIYGDEHISLRERDVIYSRGNGEGIRTLLNGPNPRQYSESLTPREILAKPVVGVNPEAEPLYAAAEGAETSQPASKIISIAKEGIRHDDAKARLAEQKGKDFTNTRTGISARLSATGVNKLISNAAVEKTVANGFTAKQHNEIAANVGALFEDASLVKTRPDRAGDANIKSIKRFVTPITVDGKEAAAWITVKESVEHGHRIYSVEGINIAALSPTVRRVLADRNSADNAALSKTELSSTTKDILAKPVVGVNPEAEPLYAAAEGAAANRAVELKPVAGKDGTFTTLSHPEARFTVDGERRTLAVDGLTVDDFEADRIERTAALVAKVEAYAANNLLKIGFYDDGVAQLWKTVKGNIAAEGKAAYEAASLEAKRKALVEQLAKSGLADGGVVETADDFERLFQELSGEALRKGEEVYGFVDPKTKKVYLNPAFFATGQGIEAPIHEFGHLGVIAAEKINKPVYDRGMKLAKELLESAERSSAVDAEGMRGGGVRGLVDFILNDRVYSRQSREVQAEELLAQLIGKRGEEALRAETDKSVVAKIKSWLVEFWNTFGKALGLKDITPEQAAKMTLEDVADAIRAEMLSGRKYGEGFAGVEFGSAEGTSAVRIATRPARIRRKRTGRVKAVDEFVSRMGGAEDPANTETDLLGLWVDNGGRLFDALPFEIETGYSKGASGVKVRRGSVADEFAESTAFYKGLNPAQRAVYFGTGKLEHGSIGEGLKAKLADAGITRFTNEDGTVDYEAAIREFERQWTNYERGEEFLKERRETEEEHDRAIVEQMEREEAAERQANDETSAAESSARAEAEAAGVMFSRGEIQQRTEDAKAKSQAMDETLGRLSQIQRDFAAEKAKTGIGIGEYYKRVNAALGANYVFDLGKPYGRIARFIPDGNLQLKLKTLMRKMKEQYKSDHPFTFDETKNLVENVNNPPIIMRRDEATAGAKVFFEAPGGRIFCASINPKGNINDIETLFPKDVERLVKTIARSKGKSKDILDVDTSKAVEMLTRWSNTTLGEHSNDLEDAVSILKNFAAVNGRPRILMSRSGIFTGSASDYANRSRQGGKDDGPSVKLKNKDLLLTDKGEVYNGSANNSASRSPSRGDNAEGNSPRDVISIPNSGAGAQGGILLSRGPVQPPEAEYVNLTRVADDAGVGEQTPGALAASRELSRQGAVPINTKGTRYVSLTLADAVALARGFGFKFEMQSGRKLGAAGKFTKNNIVVAADLMGVIDKTDLAAEKAMLKQHGFFAHEDSNWCATHSPAEVRKERERSEEALSSQLEKIADKRIAGSEPGGMAAGRKVFIDQMIKGVMAMPHGQPGALGAMQTVAGALEKRVRGSETEAETFLDWMEGVSPGGAGASGRPARSGQERKAGMFAAFLIMPKEMEARAKGWYDAIRSTIAGDQKLADAFRKMTARMMSEQGHEFLMKEIERDMDRQHEEAVQRLEREANESIKPGGKWAQAKEWTVLACDDRGGAALVRIGERERIYLAAQKEAMKKAKTPTEKAQIKQQTDMYLGDLAHKLNRMKLARAAWYRGFANADSVYGMKLTDLLNDATERDGLRVRDLSLYLDQMRVIEAHGLSGSRGESARQAQLALDAMRRRLGGDFARVEAFARRFHAIHEQEFLNNPALERVLGKSTLDAWRANIHYVTTKRTFSPEELAEIAAQRAALGKIGAFGGDDMVGDAYKYMTRLDPTAGLKGSFASKREPMGATMEKTGAIMRWVRKCDYAITLRDTLLSANVEGVHDMPAGKNEFKSNKRYGAISYVENGQRRVLVVPKEIAREFERAGSHYGWLLKPLKAVHNVVRKMLIDWNPGYGLVNAWRNSASFESNFAGARESKIKLGTRFAVPAVSAAEEMVMQLFARKMPERFSRPIMKIWGEKTFVYQIPYAKRVALWITDYNKMQQKYWDAEKRGDLGTMQQLEADRRMAIEAKRNNLFLNTSYGKGEGSYLDQALERGGMKTMAAERAEREAVAAWPAWKRNGKKVLDVATWIFRANARQQIREDAMAKLAAYLFDRANFGKTHNRTAEESAAMARKYVGIPETEYKGEATPVLQLVGQPFWGVVEKGVMRHIDAARERPRETLQKDAWRLSSRIVQGLMGSGTLAWLILKANDGDEEKAKNGPMGGVYKFARGYQRAYQNCSNYVRNNCHITPIFTDGYTSIIMRMQLTDEERIFEPIAGLISDAAAVAAGTKASMHLDEHMKGMVNVIAPDFATGGFAWNLFDDTLHALFENPRDYYTGGYKYDKDLHESRFESLGDFGRFSWAMAMRLWNDFGGRGILPTERAGVDNGLGKTPGSVAAALNSIPVASPYLRRMFMVQVGSPERDAAEITELEQKRRAVARNCAKRLFKMAHDEKRDISLDEQRYRKLVGDWVKEYGFTPEESAYLEMHYLNAWRSYEGAQYRADGEREKYRAKAERLGLKAAHIWLDFD